MVINRSPLAHLRHYFVLFASVLIDRKPRDVVATAQQVVIAFLLELASRWEMQPDTQTIHLAYASKMVCIGGNRGESPALTIFFPWTLLHLSVCATSSLFG